MKGLILREKESRTLVAHLWNRLGKHGTSVLWFI
jgi:hypothetical protein